MDTKKIDDDVAPPGPRSSVGDDSSSISYDRVLDERLSFLLVRFSVLEESYTHQCRRIEQMHAELNTLKTFKEGHKYELCKAVLFCFVMILTVDILIRIVFCVW